MKHLLVLLLTLQCFAMVANDDELEDLIPFEIEIIEEEQNDSTFEIEDSDENEKSGDKVTIDDLLVPEGPKVGGSVYFRGGGSAGYSTLNLSDSTNSIILHPALEANAYIDFDIAVSSSFRFYSRVGFVLNENDLSYDTIDVDQLYIDYTLWESLLIRLGTFPLTWGKGRLFDNPGNFVSKVEDSVSLKSTFPLFGSSFTTLIYSNENLLKAQNDYQKVAGGFFYEFPVADSIIGISSLYTKGDPIKGNLFFKTSMFGWDVALENISLTFINEAGNFDKVNYTYLINAFHQSQLLKVSVILESKGDFDFVENKSVLWGGLGLVFDELRILKMKPGIRFLHNISDNSGQIILGMKGLVLDNLSIEMALPITYGNEGTYYQTHNEDPQDRDILFAMLFTLSAKF